MSLLARIVTVLALVGLGTGCSLRGGQGKDTAHQGGPTMAFTKVTLLEYDGASPLWKLEADRVRYDDRVARLEGVIVRYYRDGQETAVCRAPGGTFDTVSRDIAFEGPMRFEGKSGSAMLEDGARWVGADRKLVAGPVQARVQIAARP